MKQRLRWSVVCGVVESARTDDSGALLMLCAIALRADTDGRADPTIGELAAFTHLQPRSVTRAIGRLEQVGAMKVERSPGRVSTYWLQTETPDVDDGSNPGRERRGDVDVTPDVEGTNPRRGRPDTRTRTRAHPPPSNANHENLSGERPNELFLLGSTPLRDGAGLPAMPDDPVTLEQIRVTRPPRIGRERP